ncbi:MAG TPA: ABC transporter substrate-binding protein [Acidimicrobiia bacterium]|nr:ABC transporter substrate-binding protein [Acidimicrobiia bacterium]
MTQPPCTEAMPRPIGWMRVALAALVVAAAGACGTRVTGGPEESLATPAPASTVAEPAGASGVPLPAAQPSPGAAPGPAGRSGTVPASTPQTETVPAPVGAHPGSAPGPAAGRPAPGQTPASSGPPTGGRTTDTAITAPGKLSPVVVASVGLYSGPLATQATGPVMLGAQIWVKSINARGGLNGHEVKLVVYDDGGDPARHRAEVQEAVETRKAIALLGNGEAVSGEGSVDYLRAKRIPDIGQDTGGSWYYSSPFYFPQTTSGLALIRFLVPSYAGRTIPKGLDKLGILYCTEVSGCDQGQKIMADEGARVGYKVVYRARVSLAQPDYTAECLAARNAGVEVFATIMDLNSMGRLAASCNRQAFKPVYGITTHAATPSLAHLPGMETAIGNANMYPYFLTDSPAIQEFHAALRTYAAQVEASMGIEQGWVAGKLLERAARNLPEPPTNEALLDGLYSIRDDDLGGLTSPLTFTRDKNPPEVSCWWDIEVHDGQWALSADRSRHCLSG